jgi:L-alanine-DL-glutamate epimerase-like enolase superfamily enzyme
MKITQVAAVPLCIPFQHGLGNGRRLDFCLVRVETDAGIVGWGDAFAYNCRSTVATAVNDMIAPLALGHDAADIAGLHYLIQKKLHIFGRFGVQAYALSGLDIALWDVAGKAAGKPVHQLLGGAKRSSIPCYASLLRYGDAALLTKYCERALGEGHTEIKLHEVTDAAVAAGRAAVPARVPLTLDVNCEWLPQDAVAAGLRFKPHGLKWLEEPAFPPEDFAALRAVGEASGIAIAAGENLCFATQFKAAFDAHALAYAQPSVTKVGGITEFVKVVQLARERGVRVAPHSPYFGPGALATLHLLAAQVPEARFEYYYLWPEASLYPGLFGGTAVQVPQGPGLGADPEPEVLRRYRA